MRTESKQLNAFIKNRLGYNVDFSKVPSYNRLSLEGNKGFKTYAETKGQSEVNCFIGFIDLKGFSSKANNSSPYEIRDFSKPFLQDISSILSRYSFIDKTIGDEVMFILPDAEEGSMVPGILAFGQLMGLLLSYSQNQDIYKFRIGVSYGPVIFDEIVTEKYTEYTAFGECIIVAKRLMSFDEVQNPKPLIAIIGVKPTITKVNIEAIKKINVRWKKSETKIKHIDKTGDIQYSVLSA